MDGLRMARPVDTMGQSMAWRGGIWSILRLEGCSWLAVEEREHYSHDLPLKDTVGDALAEELGDESVKPVVDGDRLGTEGRARLAVVPPVGAETVTGPIDGRRRGCGRS